MTDQVKKFCVQASDVTITERILIESALPSGFQLRLTENGYDIYTAGSDDCLVGSVTVEGLTIVFEIINGDAGTVFASRLEKSFPNLVKSKNINFNHFRYIPSSELPIIFSDLDLI